MHQYLLELPDWVSTDPPHMYTRPLANSGDHEAIYPSRWDHPSIPSLIEHVCEAAARPPPPVLHGCFYGDYYSGSLENALTYLPKACRQLLVSRDPALLNRIGNMIEVADERQCCRPIPVLHLEYAVYSNAQMSRAYRMSESRKRRNHPGEYLDTDPRGYRDEVHTGVHWCVDIELTDTCALAENPTILGGLSVGPRNTTLLRSKDREAARSILRGLHRRLGDPRSVALLNDQSVLWRDALLVPVIHHLSTGAAGPPRVRRYCS